MGYVRAQFIIATLWIIVMETGAVTRKLVSVEDQVGQILPYWDPDPRYGSRRMDTDQKYLIEPINKERKSQLFRRGRPVEPIVHWSSHEEYANLTTKQREGVNQSKKNRFQNSGKDLLTKQRQMKLRQMRVNVNEDEEARSTRMAPLQLMQQQEDNVKQDQKTVQAQDDRPGGTHKGNIEPSSSDLLILNAYFVEMQFTQMLLEFDDVEFSTEKLGRTASYIDIVLFKLTQKNNRYFRAHDIKYVDNEKKEKKILFIVHALSPMGLGHLYSLTLESHLKMLLSYYIAHLDKFDIYLIPMANPDGYLQSKKVTYWNKNNAPQPACSGVDVDRNFDVAWNETHRRLSTCSQRYAGAFPFSEPESKAVRDIFHRMSHKIIAYFHVHGGSYKMNTFKGDAVLYPKGYTDQQSDDDKYIDLKGEIDEAVKNANFKVLSVTVDTLYNWYGKVTGSSVDYASTVYGIPYAMELVMQLYQDSYETHYDKLTKLGGNDLTSLETHSLAEIWRRIIDVIFTNIYKKLEGNDASRIR